MVHVVDPPGSPAFLPDDLDDTGSEDIELHWDSPAEGDLEQDEGGDEMPAGESEDDTAWGHRSLVLVLVVAITAITTTTLYLFQSRWLPIDWP